MFRHGGYILPSKAVVATWMMAALAEHQWRDPKTGRLTRSRKAVQVRAAAMQDMMRAYTRATYALAHEPIEPATLINGVVRLGDHFAEHLDNKPVGGMRITKIVLSSDEPSEAIPPEQGRRQLGPPSPAEDGYVEVTEEDAP